MRRLFSALSVAALAAALLPPTAAAAPGTAERLVSATATFSPATRVAGMPTSTAPQHQLVMPEGGLSVTVEYGYHWETGALSYHYSLDTEMGEPDPSSNTRVMLGFGTFQGTTCQVEEATTATAYRYIPDVLLYDNKDTDDLASAAAWDCAVLAVSDRSAPPTLFDVFVSPLDVVKATPELALHAPRKDRLVKGVWTRVPVRVTNSAAEEISARDVVVTGKGKGVKVRPIELGVIRGQDDSESSVWVKLTRPKATLRLQVSDLGQRLGTAKVKLRRRPAPAPPKAGSWSGGRADFTVRGGKVRGFRVFTETTCGGYPDMPTTTQNTYSFKTTPIPRNNELVGTEKGNKGQASAYSAYLNLEFVSPTKVKGTFSYYGPARCQAIEGFTAKLQR